MPWRLGPTDGRYLLRDTGTTDGPPTHILVLATLGAPERRRLARRARQAAPSPEATPVTTSRATVIDTGVPAGTEQEAGAWLHAAGEDDLAAGLGVLNRALHAYRLVTSDPYQHPVGRAQLLVARVGFGLGEEVAEGRWTQAREIDPPATKRGRARVLTPQARLAAVLGGREPLLACEELTLRARLDLDQGRGREAALQSVVALDAALAELAAEARTAGLVDRLTELRGLRDPLASAAQAALSGPLGDEQRQTVATTVGRIEAALRARAAAGA